VVIAIISLLVSILLPSLQQAKILAKRVVCVSNLKQCGSAMFIYASQNDGGLPFRENWSYLYRRPPEAGETPEADGWVYVNCGLLVSGEYISEDALRCPASGEEGLNTWGWGAQNIKGPYWYLQVTSGYWQDNSVSPPKPKKIPVHDLWTTVLMSDYFLGREGTVSGFYHGEEGINAMFTDGSARWLDDRDIYDYIYGTRDDLSGWNNVTYCWWEYLDTTY
jgi:type II secretory pathway pseudopilin PulG